MSDREQAQHLKDRLLQYSPNSYPNPEMHNPEPSMHAIPPVTQPPMPLAATGVETPAYTGEFYVQETPQETSPPKRVKRIKEFSAIKAGIILISALIVSAALIIYALTRFIG